MHATDAVIAVFADHPAAEAAVRKLTVSGFATTTISVVGKAYDRDEKAVGFYNADGQIRFWGVRGPFWGRMWDMFAGGMFVTVPVVGPVIVLGRLAGLAMSAIEDERIVGGLNAVGAALFGIGIPKDSATQYEFAVKADGFLVIAHVAGADSSRVHAILASADPARLDIHVDPEAPRPAFHLAATGD